MKIQRASITTAAILSSAFLLSSCANKIEESSPKPQGTIPTETTDQQKSSDKKPARQKCGVNIRCMVA